MGLNCSVYEYFESFTLLKSICPLTEVRLNKTGFKIQYINIYFKYYIKYSVSRIFISSRHIGFGQCIAFKLVIESCQQI